MIGSSGQPAWSKAKVRGVAETIGVIVGREVARMAPRPPRLGGSYV